MRGSLLCTAGAKRCNKAGLFLAKNVLYYLISTQNTKIPIIRPRREKRCGLNKYKKLLTNTLLFALSSFGSKVLVYLMMPLYTNILSPEEYGIVTNIQDTSQLLLPLAAVGIANAIIRFGLEAGTDKKAVFTGGIAALGIGTGLIILLYPLLAVDTALEGYRWLVYLYVIISCARNLCSQFVRARQLTRLYAFDGVLNTLMLVIFYVVYLVPCKMGVVGYILATITADALSGLFLFTVAGLHNYIDRRRFDKVLFKNMLKYSVPLIPASMCWWITNASAKKFVLYMMGSAEAGLYAFAYKIPNLLMLVSTLFTEAWQLSAVADAGEGKERSRFFSRVFSGYQGILTIAASGIILFAKVFVTILDGSDGGYYDAWAYIPILVIATVYSCYANYLSSVYMVAKKSALNLYTTMAGAGLNLLLNWVMIPIWGVNGATVATLLSYLLVFGLRAVNTRKFIPFDLHLQRLGFNTVLLLVQAVLMLLEPTWWVWGCGAVFAVLLATNFAGLLQLLKVVIGRTKRGV